MELNKNRKNLPKNPKDPNVIILGLLSISITIFSSSFIDVSIGKLSIFIIQSPLNLFLAKSVIVLLFVGFFYLLLEPLHELGHYSIAKYFTKKHNLSVEFTLRRNETLCSDWKAFTPKTCKIILLSGSLFKIGYCFILITIFLIKTNLNSIIIFLNVILWEIISNSLPIIKSSDGYKIFHLEDFYNELFSKEKDTTFFITKIYPILLIILSIIIICII